MIKIWLDGAVPAVDVFGNPPKQLQNFAEVGGRVIQIDVGEQKQCVGVSFHFYRILSKKKNYVVSRKKCN